MKLRNKITGEIIEKGIRSQVATPKLTNGDIFTQRAEKAQQEIAKRGSLWGNIIADIQSPNVIKKVVGGLQAMGSPLTQLEAGIANPALLLQTGDLYSQAKAPTTLGVLGEGARRLAEESFKGFTGRRLGQYGDVYRAGGVPSPLAATAGFTLAMSPVKAIQVLNRTFGAVTKLSDKGIMNAGNALIKAGGEAKVFTGTKLNEAFRTVDNVKVNADDFLNAVSKLPKTFISKLEEMFGNLDEVAGSITVGRLRQLKQTIGKVRPTVFGREARGAVETLEVEDINKVYSAIKKLMASSVEKATNKKTADALMKMEDTFTQVSRASDYIKKIIVEPTLRKPTRAGGMAGKMVVEGDVSGRIALTTLKKSGKEARKTINQAVSALEAFNKWRAIVETTQHVIRAATYGGAIGAAGGMAAGKMAQRAGVE